MKKNLKRIVSVFLTLTIVLSMFSLCFVTSGALTTDDQTEETNVFELGDQETLCSPKSSECDHFCHSTNGFISFLYKIFSFFWKLFEINKYCQCGTAHYGLVTINLDSDANGIPDCIDNNDYATDTDGDGLSDYQEYIYCCTDPLVVDTDGDGKNDADSDTDNDTLSNKYELSIGTNPASEDTDDDYLNDADELAAKTDPLIADTDGDGAKDGWELQNGYDPLVYDSSFSVVAMAYNESESNDIGASVCVDVDGEQTDTIKVRPVNENENALISNSIAGYMGTAYDFTMDGTFDEATLEFTYDSSLGEIGEDFQPRIYYLNEEDGVFEELPEQTVEDGKVTAVTTHFSTYILLNKAEFDKIWNDEIKSPIVDSQGRQSGIDVVFALDVSNSMNSYSRLSTAKTALNAFLDALDDNDRAALVKFNTTSTTVSGLTDNISSVKSVVSSITASGNTSMYNGLSNAIDILSQDMDYGYKLIIILSDGSDVPFVSYDSYYSPLVNKAIANDITIYTVGAGTSVSTSVLTNIANETGGSYYAATATSSIIDAFGYVKSDTVDVKTDSNNDGIPDYYAELIKNGEMVLSNGSLALKGVDLNASDDIDNDGLKNGEEVVVVENNGRVYLKYESSPIKEDTDGDGFTDYEDPTPLKADVFKSMTDYKKNKYDDKITVTIYARQPVWNSRMCYSFTGDSGFMPYYIAGGSGHSYLGIDYADEEQYYFGFYGNDSDDGLSAIAIGRKNIPGYVQGELYDGESWNNYSNGDPIFTISKTFEISNEQASKLFDYIEENRNNEYNIETYNCTTFAVEALKYCGLNVELYEHNWTHDNSTLSLITNTYYGYSPADVCQDIKENYSSYVACRAYTINSKNGEQESVIGYEVIYK